MSLEQSDRNLLFGILAVQMDFIDRDALLTAMGAWVLDKGKPLGHVLRGQALSEEHLALLEALVQAHLQKHGGDPQQSLSALSTANEALPGLRQITDSDVQASLSRAPVTRADPGLTGPYATADLPPQSRFRVLRPHARGGLGEVSVALDKELHREVALKEIQPRHAAHPESRARFLLEAEVTGGLEHPGVVPVYGLGAYPDGRPFYAMRFVRGDSLKEAIEQFHREKESLPAGERALRLRGLLGRFVAVCQAVAYAHSRGVLHRDLKPANVMVGKYGETLVVDWGLAKLLDRTEVESAEGALRPTLASDPTATQPGAALGTPAYMSPEQAAGRLDLLGPASDVYSLGATLYSVLTGRPPLTDPDTGEVLRRVQRGDFPRPREASPHVPPALEAVCLKAMALRPEERYGTPEELAADVERWLADEPVGAHREPLPARLARWARRHRASVLSAAAALAVLVLSLGVLAVVLTGHNRALAAANTREREAKGQEREARDRAEANFRLARQAVKDYCVTITLSPRLRQADLTGLRKELLETATRFHQRFKEQEGDDPEVRAERAYAYFELAYIAKETGASEEALGHYREALALWLPLTEAHPDNRGYRLGLADCYNSSASLYATVGRPAEAEGAYRKALALYQELADAAPGGDLAQASLAGAHGNLGLWLAGRARWKEAEEQYEKAAALWQALADADTGSVNAARGLADMRHKLGYLYYHTNRRQQAGEAYRQALAVRQRLSREHPNNAKLFQDLGFSHLNLGQWYRNAGQSREAEESHQQAVAVFQKLADAYPSVPDHQSDQAMALGDLGLFYQAEGRTQQALEVYRRALAIEERLAKRYPAIMGYALRLGGSYCNMGLRSRQNGEAKAALGWFDKAQATLEQARRRDRDNGTATRYLCNTHSNRADALLDLDRPAEAIQEWDQALELDATDEDRAYTRLSRAYAVARLGKYEQATPLAEEVIGRADAKGYMAHRAAQVFSQASAAVGQDERRGKDERQKLAEQYAARAVTLLRRARSGNYFKGPVSVARFQKDRAFDPLRQRPDFQKLLGELGKKP